jgi:thiamine phosphate synthase YjbQ (UPF0047 family)
MKSYRSELRFKTKQRREFINITPQVEQCLRESGINEGFVLCNAMHITASVFINGNEPGLHQDFETWLEKLAPERPYTQYAWGGGQRRCASEAKYHGPQVVVAVTVDDSAPGQIFYDSTACVKPSGEDHRGIGGCRMRCCYFFRTSW